MGATSLMRAVEQYLRPTGPTHEHTLDLGPLDMVVADGARMQIDLNGHRILLTRTGFNVIALDLTCTHSACPLHVSLDAGRILCRCHGGAFDLNGNPVQAPPTRALRRIVTQVTDGVLFIRMPARGLA